MCKTGIKYVYQSGNGNGQKMGINEVFTVAVDIKYTSCYRFINGGK